MGSHQTTSNGCCQDTRFLFIQRLIIEKTSHNCGRKIDTDQHAQVKIHLHMSTEKMFLCIPCATVTVMDMHNQRSLKGMNAKCYGLNVCVLSKFTCEI